MTRRLRSATVVLGRPGIAGTGITAAEKTAMQATDAGLQTQVNALGADIDAILNAPTSLPVVPGLFAHWDATTLGLADGARVSAWTDSVTGTVQAVQADAGKQPRYDANGINGKPAVTFDTARNDNLQATGLTTGSLTATVFVVAVPPSGIGANHYLFGDSVNRKNIYHSTVDRIGLQGVSTFVAPFTPNTPIVVAGVFDAAASKLRINQRETSGDVGEAPGAPIGLTLGHRTSLAAGAGFTGPIGEVLYYTRALTSDECAAVEAYLAAKWAIPITPQVTWHVDSIYGDDTNTGRTPGTALKTLSRALAGIDATNAADATVVIHAPAVKPLREPGGLSLNTGTTIRLVSRTPGQRWHLYGSVRAEGGWAAAGGGVYSRALTVTTDVAPAALVTTLLDADGQETRVFTRNTTTPTTPAAGEYGYTGGTYYLHLPGDADPNQHSVEIATANNLMAINTGTVVHGVDAALMGAQTTVVIASGSGAFAPGLVTFTDSEAWFSGGSGWGTGNDHVGMTLLRCRAWYASNDGFNHHGSAGNAAIMELVDCEGFWNGDEGVSPHDDTRLILRDGSYHHNGHGGLTAVNRSVTQLSGTEFYANRQHDATVTGWDSGGVSILEQARLISTNLYSHDNPGPGVEIDTAAGATWTDNGGTRSGAVNGNGAPDSV